MRIPRARWFAGGLGAFALTLLNGCAVTGYGVDGSVGYGAGYYGYDDNYYEPWGYDYGGWGPGYLVGPGRGGDWHGGDRGGGDWHGGGQRGGDWHGDRRGNQPSRPYRSAPSSRRMPSIPRGSRGSHH